MFGANDFSGVDSDARFLEASREGLFFVLDRFFHPRVICTDPGGTCGRIEDTIRLLSRNLEREERLMLKTGYPRSAAHKWAHDALLRKLDRMKHTLVCGDYDNALVFDFMTKWLKTHSATYDKHFNKFLLARRM